MMTDYRDLKASEGKVAIRDLQLMEVYQRVTNGVYGDGERPQSYAHFIDSLKIDPTTALPTPSTIGPHRKRLHPRLRL
jgi:hypothetical protein